MTPHLAYCYHHLHMINEPYKILCNNTGDGRNLRQQTSHQKHPSICRKSAQDRPHLFLRFRRSHLRLQNLDLPFAGKVHYLSIFGLVFFRWNSQPLPNSSRFLTAFAIYCVLHYSPVIPIAFSPMCFQAAASTALRKDWYV